ncbi:hypothetical protein LSAT2_028202 [Lamellibrachia satsuma]|nr:hypothetical protein LSAT2_028202 [Lamellibrachia satsuma]
MIPAVSIVLIWTFPFLKTVCNRQPYCCRQVPDIDKGAEDIHVLPNGLAFITSGFDAQSRGDILLFDFKKPSHGAHALDIVGDLDRSTFSPLGISIWKDCNTPKTGKQWLKNALLGVRQHAEALNGQMKRDTNMRLRRGCGKNKKQHHHHCHPVSSALAAARTATQESAFTATVDATVEATVDATATVDAAKIFETTLCLLI